ncbi:DUF1389 domain-containing protein [Chlamydia vaughanii]|uniref:DUF1389 domain-containing protein n=1 Tax=Chlamydia vaughanii TaxID=3112552 RepID=UPI0032B1D031
MRPEPSIPSSTNQVNQLGNTPPRGMKSSHKLALVIGGVALAILAIACVAMIACGIVHPGVIAGLVVSIVASGAMLAPVLLSCRRRPGIELDPEGRPEAAERIIPAAPLSPTSPQTPIPGDVLNVIEQAFPKCIRDLCVSQRLKIQEFRQVLQGVGSGDFSSLPADVRGKVDAFGKERLIAGCQNLQLPNLDSVLTKHCPLFFLNKFVQLGSRDIPEAEGLTPEVYWTGRASLLGKELAVDACGWLYASVVTQNEHQLLTDNARGHTWDQVQNTVEQVGRRMRDKLGTIDDSLVNKGALRQTLGFPYKLLSITQHGMSWEQLLLLKEVGIGNCNFLQENEYKGRYGWNLARTMKAVSPYIDEGYEANYDPDIALMTWTKLQSLSRNLYDSGMSGAHEVCLHALAQASRRGTILNPLPLEGPTALPTPTYEVNLQTGERTVKLM